jgi:hypothetical protein
MEDKVKWILKRWEKGRVNWTDLVLDKSRWRAVVKRVTDFWVPEIRGIS